MTLDKALKKLPKRPVKTVDEFEYKGILFKVGDVFKSHRPYSTNEFEITRIEKIIVNKKEALFVVTKYDTEYNEVNFQSYEPSNFIGFETWTVENITKSIKVDKEVKDLIK